MSDTAAIELLKRAVQLDGEQKYPDALTCYSEAIRMLLKVVKEIPMSEERKRTAYQQKITECMDRAEKLKEFIEQKKEACVPSNITLRCPNNYVIVVRSASHGVAQISNTCSYKPGDCIVDSMNSISCLTDSTQCLIHATKKLLPQCNDQYSSYFHIEYDCIPISMDDTSKEYNICQNSTEITSDHGIIRSPGYPTQFQLTSFECFRFIHVSDDKIIRLWLTDLYIDSNCINDHVYVVDNVQTYKHCGLQRYAYPYLCSSTIIIQYLVKNTFKEYRGMRMYFEIVNRPVNDNCPKLTVTPVPSTTITVTTIEPGTTTNTPIYVLLGIASPTRSFQLCAGESYTIQCPTNYVIAVITNIFGVTSSDECELHDASKHCVITTSPIFLCGQTCFYMYPGNQLISSCNNTIAAYQYVEYQCIPIKTPLISPNTSCSNINIHIDRNGQFQSYNYPKLTNMNCTYHLQTKPGYIMHIYALDISLNNYNPICQLNKMSLFETTKNQSLDFCEQRTNSLIYSSCSNQLDLHYMIMNDLQAYSYGIKLYIESQAQPFGWSCGEETVTTLTNPTTIQTTPTPPKPTSITSLSIMTVLDPIEYDICYNDTFIHTCPYGFTFMILNAFYGVKNQSLNKCEFIQNDCTQEALLAITQCQTDAPNCYLSYSNKRRLAHCLDKYADYLHITYQCVPSFPISSTSNLVVYDICDTNKQITDINGIVISPNFPSYQQTNKECQREILGIHDRALKIWINELAISSNTPVKSDKPDFIIYKTNNIEPTFRDICIDDYLIINTPHIAYIYCGIRKLSLEPICTTSVIIQYKTTSSTNPFSKGFKFYFEWIEKPMDILCIGNPSTYNPLISTTTSINEPLPIWAQNLDVSYVLSKQICLGTTDTLQCPRSNDYVISIRNSNYAVTGTGFCEIPSFSHCLQETSLSLTCTHSCFLEYIIPKPLPQCEDQTADYIKIEYECIPTRLPNHENPIDICASTTTDTIAIDKGMIISPYYPSLSSTHICPKTIETIPNKLWMIYIVDLFLEAEDEYGDCIHASLEIYDGNDKRIICGLQQPELVLISCSNIVQFNFISNQQALGYRGFKIYFKTIDVPIGWSCVPSGLTTTSTTQTSPSITLLPPSLQVVAYGGTTMHGSRHYCQFPFIYQGKQYTNCIADKPPHATPDQTVFDPWCSLTHNHDIDDQWGFCDIGVTDSTIYSICQNQLQTIQCSPGYVIDILTADYATKQDGTISCNYNKNDCFQSDASTIENLCSGKTSCTVYHYAKTLVSCQNRLSTYLHIDYTCVPNDIETIMTYDICHNDSRPTGDIRRGFLISPNFPNVKNNINCIYDLHILKPHQDIYLYIIDMDLDAPNLLGQSCTNDRLIIRADNSVTEWCGRSYTNLLLKTCHTSVSVQLIRALEAKGRGVKLYFEFRQRSPNEICEEIITPGTTQPTLTTLPTTIPSRPDYFPDPSPHLIKTLCYPDVSALFGTNNFQCPSDYIIVIHRAFYGKGTGCVYTPGDCTNEADNIYRLCSGKQACSVSFLNTFYLSECGQTIANYLFVQYQCLPTSTIVSNINDICTNQNNQLSPISGILQSTLYPSYTQTQCINITLSPPENSNFIIYMYLLDLNIDIPDVQTGNCTNDYLLLSYQCNNKFYDIYLCGIHQTELLFDTCLTTDKIFISYNLTNQNPQSKRGFSLLYHLLPTSIKTTLPSTTITTTTTLSTTMTTSISRSSSMSTTTLQSTVTFSSTNSTAKHPTEVDTSTKPTNHNPNNKFLIIGIITGVIVVLLCLIIIIYYRRRRSHSKTIDEMPLQNRRNTSLDQNFIIVESIEKRTSIPVAALRGPAISSFRIKTYHEQIQIKDGAIGNSYEKIFSRFLDENVTEIIVQDPYIRAYHQITNFLRFCEAGIKSPAKIKQITLITSTETNEQTKKIQIEQLNEFKEHLRKTHSIELIINYVTGLHDREIKLNNGWIIKIGRGLDFYKPPECKLSIGYYDLDLRPCHQTTIDIFHTERIQSSS
ncbi:unnamed protein product [Adineta steineri]|uniref:MIT domain-containing protein n=2 Tax=Adineta steineri TaxID=433720 RepID=A0A813P6F0_9BILA|nr:unnamed protein product [Adineta steineri]CAF0864015.1 unnamed protein product [Adineta steineri]